MKRLILTCMCFASMFLCAGVAHAVAGKTFAAEIVSMDFSGDVAGFYVEVQGLPSAGELTFLDVGGGQYHIDSFFDVFTELSVDGGPFEPFNGSAYTSLVVNAPTGDLTGTFSTELVSMTLSGDYGGTPVMVRESPTLHSYGEACITDIGGGMYHIDSFFDVYTELSLDGGQSFMPGLYGTACTSGNVPEPAGLAMLMWIALVSLFRRKKQR